MITLQKIAELVKGTLAGQPDYLISSVKAPDEANENEIAFIANDDAYQRHIPFRGGALIVPYESKFSYKNLIYVKNPYIAFALLLGLFFPKKRVFEGIDKLAKISKNVLLGDNVSVGPFTFIGENTTINDDTEIHAGVVIYDGVKIGKNCLIYSNVVIRENVEIGNNVIIQPGAVIGSDGFGFTPNEEGIPMKIPQVGRVIIGEHSEIGANTCIDRATISRTKLGNHVKLDNLVQIGHNVQVGECTLISSQTGISGSTHIGERVVMGGQVGIADHLNIASGVSIVAKSGVASSIKEKSVVGGLPAMEFKRTKKIWAIIANLDKLRDTIKILENKIKRLEEKK